MNEIHISATPPPALQACQENFSVVYPNLGRGTVSLSPDGVYSVLVSGITEGAAYRSQEYKTAQDCVTGNMIRAYENYNLCFTALHRQMQKLVTLRDCERELQAVVPQTYRRSVFALPRPTKSEVEADLQEEVKALKFVEEASGTAIDERAFVNARLGRLVEKRQDSWRQASDLFDEIESAREAQANARFQAEYKRTREQKLGVVEGRAEAVEEAMKELAGGVHTPYNLVVAYDYHREQALLGAQVVVESGLVVPTLKAVRLASGKISVKNKLVREATFDRTNAVVSLAYYMASALFNVNPRVEHLRLSLYDQTLQAPLLGVVFERTRFAETRLLTGGLIADVQTYPNVTCFKMRGEALELVAMKAADFERRVAALTGEA